MITSVQVNNVRNISQVLVKPSPIVNIFYGDNGSGKSSFLEALFLLSTGRSFRTSELKNLIKFDESSLLVRSEISKKENTSSIGFSFTKAGIRVAKRDGEKLKNSSELAKSIPLKFLSPLVSELVEGSPSVRRKYVDWLMFHVEHGYINRIKHFKTVLANRNAVLKNKDREQEPYWTSQFISLSEELANLCSRTCEALAPYIQQALTEFLVGVEVEVNYYQGWNVTKSLEELLEKNKEIEFKFGSTRYGFQRSDLRLTVKGRPINLVLSRGQMKLCSLALQLAQVRFIKELNGLKCTVLIDDVIAELDDANVCRVVDGFIDSESQCFITSANDKLPEILSSTIGKNYKLFHVEHGTITEEEYP